MKPLRPYILDDAATSEYQRLDLMSKILDPWTRGYLRELGAGPVGPSGSGTAVDVNAVLLDLVPAQNLTVRQMDVRADRLPANTFDLVTCRALLHQISEHARSVLERMGASVKPGGWLLIQEPDFHLAPTTEPEAWAATWRALIRWGHAQGVDWLIG